MKNKTNLILHPVRMRILVALRGRNMTPLELSEMLSDVAQATLYRHINSLHEGGLIEVVEERQVRSVTESVYGLTRENIAHLSAEDLEDATRDDHLRYFTIFVSVLLGDFARYLEREELDIEHDGVGYQQHPLYLTDDELSDFIQGLTSLLSPLLENQPADDRKRYLFSVILMPGDKNS